MNSWCAVAAAGRPLRHSRCLIAGLRRLAAAAPLVALLSGCADQAPKRGSEVTASRATLTGIVTKLDFITSLHPDCTFVDYGTIRTLVPPSHGRLTFDRGSDFTNYQTNNQRFDCNKQTSPGTLVHYQSDPSYAGTDRAKIEVIYPDASLKTISYRLAVGTTAEEQSAKDIPAARTAVSGSLQKLDFLYSKNPDCSSLGEMKVRVTLAPSHGTLTIKDGEDYTEFVKNNPRYDCNKQKLPGSIIYYQSEAGYTGQDSAKVEIISPTGTISSILYKLTVE